MTTTSPSLTMPKFVPNKIIQAREDHYLTVTVSLAKVVESWRLSLFSYEWMRPNGTIKTRDELTASEQERRDEVERLLEKNEPLDTPILGIGLMDNIEIGSGRATILTLYFHGIKTMPVHIPRTHENEFKNFLA
jgi:hypothetical protein